MNKSFLRLKIIWEDKALGWKLSGAGGGGYLTLVSDKPIENGVRVVVRGRNGS